MSDVRPRDGGNTGGDGASRARVAEALHRARVVGFGEGEYIGQENYMTAGEMVALADDAGVTDDALVLDACCGQGGLALHLAREMGCRIVGVDRSREAVALALAGARDAGLVERAAFVVGDAVRLPLAASFDAALLLETMLAIRDKAALLGELHRLLKPGGRLGLTLEEGRPLTPDERRRIPEGDEVWLISEDEFLALLEATGFLVRRVADHTPAHANVATSLVTAISRERRAIIARLGADQYERIHTLHTRWQEWLSTRRVRKLVLVAERVD